MWVLQVRAHRLLGFTSVYLVLANEVVCLGVLACRSLSAWFQRTVQRRHSWSTQYTCCEVQNKSEDADLLKLFSFLERSHQLRSRLLWLDAIAMKFQHVWQVCT